MNCSLWKFFLHFLRNLKMKQSLKIVPHQLFLLMESVLITFQLYIKQGSPFWNSIQTVTPLILTMLDMQNFNVVTSCMRSTSKSPKLKVNCVEKSLNQSFQLKTINLGVKMTKMIIVNYLIINNTKISHQSELGLIGF